MILINNIELRVGTYIESKYISEHFLDSEGTKGIENWSPIKEF